MLKIPCPVSEAVLRSMVQDQKLTESEIASILPGGTVHRVRNWKKRFGIGSVPRWARNVVPPIEGSLRSLLVGSMLGDGRLVRRPNATHYTENHSDKQKNYLEWKIAQWGIWASPDAIQPVIWNTQGGSYSGWRFNTVAHEQLNKWHSLFYPQDVGPKHLKPQVVDLVDDKALAIWYLDDGSAGWWPSITFGMDEESRRIAFAIFAKFGLTPKWDLQRGKTGDFVFDSEELALRFLGIIGSHVPFCMEYKLKFGFQGPHYRIRQRVTATVLREMVAQGFTIRRMAEKLGVGWSTIDRALKRFQIDCPRLIGRPKGVTT